MTLHIHPDLQPRLHKLATDGVKIAEMLLSVHFTTTVDGNYLNFIENDCHLSYRPTNRLYDSYDPYSSRGRMAGRPGRIARRFLTADVLDNLTDVDFEKFANALEAYREDVGEFSLVSGTAIKDAYHHTQYAPHSGSLNSSCMAYAACQSYFNIYTQNPTVCQLLTLRKDGLLHGRALVWTLMNGKRILDRVYGTDKTIRHITAWAEENGIGSRDDGDFFREDARVQLTNWMFARYPYMDTFRFLSRKSGQLINNSNDPDLTRIVLGGTHGTDWYGAPLVFRIPVVRLSTDAREVQLGWVRISGATSPRGAQRQATARIREQRYYGLVVNGVTTGKLQRGMADLDMRRWRKLTAKESRFFQMHSQWEDL